MKDHLKVAFYKGNRSFITKLIAFWTFGKYSHCAVLLKVSDGNIYTIGASHLKGVAEYCELYREEDWDIISLEYADRDYVVEFIRDKIGDEYDYSALWLTHLIPLMKQREGRWFCSEIIAAALGLEKPHKYHPNNLYKELSKTQSNRYLGLADLLGNLRKIFGR